jgi:hypothetical protein
MTVQTNQLCRVCQEYFAKTGSDLCVFCAGLEWHFLRVEPRERKKAGMVESRGGLLAMTGKVVFMLSLISGAAYVFWLGVNFFKVLISGAFR